MLGRCWVGVEPIWGRFGVDLANFGEVLGSWVATSSGKALSGEVAPYMPRQTYLHIEGLPLDSNRGSE